MPVPSRTTASCTVSLIFTRSAGMRASTPSSGARSMLRPAPALTKKPLLRMTGITIWCSLRRTTRAMPTSPTSSARALPRVMMRMGASFGSTISIRLHVLTICCYKNMKWMNYLNQMLTPMNVKIIAPNC